MRKARALRFVLTDKDIYEEDTDNRFSILVEELEDIHNSLSEDYSGLIATQQASLQNAITNIEQNFIMSIYNKVVNDFTEEKEVVNKKDKREAENMLKKTLEVFYLSLIPIYANNLTQTRNNQFQVETVFRMDSDIKNFITLNATKASESHIQTITDDVLRSLNKVQQDALETELAQMIRDKNPEFTNKQVKLEMERIKLEDADLYKLARDRALAGDSQYNIRKAIQEEYQNVSNNRAKTIARTETNRAFTTSQFEADRQFLESNNLMGKAYKIWEVRSDNPCIYCEELASRGPIPFEKNFVNIGGTIVVDEGSKVNTMHIDYESLEAGNAHPNCGCRYRLVIEGEQL
jgi:hypothetical protein